MGARGPPRGSSGGISGHPPARVGRGSTHIVLGGVPPLLHIHHRGVLHAVGQHLPPNKASGALQRRHLLIPVRLPLLPLPGSQGNRTLRPPRRCRGSRRPQVRPRDGDGQGGHAGSVRPGRLPVGLPRAPSLPRRRRRRSSQPRPPALGRPPPGGSGGNWRSGGGAGVCPAGEGTGRGPRSLLSARWGGAGGAPSPRSGSGGLGAG